MKIQTIQSQPDAELSAALERFEAAFRYPLGESAWFRISHGKDYTRFFRAIGNARCFIAREGSDVIGTITSSICRIRTPDGKFQRGGYISDLKVSQSASGRALLRLLRAATEWTLIQPTPSFCVVMEGTAKSPAGYTGRLGIPVFEELAKLMILRIPTDSRPDKQSPQSASVVTCDPGQVRELHRKLTSNCYATDGGDSSLRSQMPPIGLIASDGSACGLLEDTRRCKQLFRHDGEEMVSAHLSCFGFQGADRAVDLIRAALEQCRAGEIPALFVCLAPQDAAKVQQLLQDERSVEAPATVFGYSFAGEGKWSVNTAEI